MYSEAQLKPILLYRNGASSQFVCHFNIKFLLFLNKLSLTTLLKMKMLPKALLRNSDRYSRRSISRHNVRGESGFDQKLAIELLMPWRAK